MNPRSTGTPTDLKVYSMIRSSPETRDALKLLAKELHYTMEYTIQFLIDEHLARRAEKQKKLLAVEDGE